MKILLLNPPAAEGIKVVREGRCMQREGAWTAVWSPVSLATIGAILEKEDFEVRLNDCIVEDIDFNKLDEIIRNFKPSLIICNTATPSIKSDLKVASLAKSINPEIKIAFFGIQVTALPDDCFKIESQIDFIIRGEPEITALELALSFKNNKPYEGIDGLSYQKEDRIIHNKERKPIQDLDSLPFPAWNLVKIGKYRLPFSGRPFLLITTGRGCPYHCNFCAAGTYYGKGLRLPSVKRVVDELAWVQNKFKVRDFLFWSESFTINKNFAEGVCDEILKRGLKIKFVCNSRVTGIDRELMLKLKEAGCWMIGYGVESASQEILDRANKQVRVENIKEAVRWAKEAGLEVTAHIILGLPGETIENIKKTVQLCIDLDIDFMQVYCAVPFPGSKLYQEAQKNGWIKETEWASFEQNFSVMDLPTISHWEVIKWRSWAFRKFYFRPKMIFRTLKRIKGFNELKYFFWMIKEFRTWIF